jgi:hypothetical protein
MRVNHKYVISTGWWCVETTNVEDERRVTVGSDEIRSSSFFKKWHAAIDRFTNPAKILVVDSSSPTLPVLPADKRVELLRLDRNAGHQSKHTGKFCGVTLAHICGMVYALCCDVDYWVYIEQDALIHGDGIVETAISAMRRDYMWGCGLGTGQPMQQSMMVVRTAAIPEFLNRLLSISARDGQITPEMKFAIAASPLVRWLPELLFHQRDSTNLSYRLLQRFRQTVLFRYAGGFDVLPFGYGRKRPINFADTHFYFQHGTAAELESYYTRFSKANAGAFRPAEIS